MNVEDFWRLLLPEDGAGPVPRPGFHEGGPHEPRRFTRYPGLPRRPLCRESGPPWLSPLLRYTAGISATELGPATRWPYHRWVPSARCFFPTDVYCWLPGDGVYHYDPAHHALVRLRGDDVRGELERAAGLDLADAAGLLVLASSFWRTAFRYGDYAYRLCAQEAGLVAGNALMLAAALGLRARLCHRYRDAAVHALLGLDWPEQSATSLIPLWTDRRADSGEVSTGDAAPPPAARDARDRIDRVRCEGLLAVDRAARTEPVDGGFDRAGLEKALRRRTSGGPVFTPLRRPIELATVRRILRYAQEPHDGDAVDAGAPLPVECHLWTIDVTDQPGRCYRLVDGELGVGRPWAPPPDALLAPNIHYPTANFVVFLAADRAWATARFGDRAIRVLHQEAGVVAQRICVRCGAEGLAARIHNGYRGPAVTRAPGRPSQIETLFQIVVGTAAPTEHYQMPVYQPGGGGNGV